MKWLQPSKLFEWAKGMEFGALGKIVGYKILY